MPLTQLDVSRKMAQVASPHVVPDGEYQQKEPTTIPVFLFLIGTAGAKKTRTKTKGKTSPAFVV